MEIISTAIGFVLVFESKKALGGLIENLHDQYNWIEKENVDPPYIYGTCGNESSMDELNKLVARIKERGTVS